MKVSQVAAGLLLFYFTAVKTSDTDKFILVKHMFKLFSMSMKDNFGTVLCKDLNSRAE